MLMLIDYVLGVSKDVSDDPGTARTRGDAPIVGAITRKSRNTLITRPSQHLVIAR